MAGLDCHAVHLEAHAGFGVNAVAAIEIGIFDRVDPVRIGGQKPRIGPGGRDQAGLFDRFQPSGEGVHACHGVRGGCSHVLAGLHRPAARRRDQIARLHRDLPRFNSALVAEKAIGLGQRRFGNRPRRAEVAVARIEQRHPVAHQRIAGQDRIDQIGFKVGRRGAKGRRLSLIHI